MAARPRPAASSSCGASSSSASSSLPTLISASAKTSGHGQNPGSSTPARGWMANTGSMACSTASGSPRAAATSARASAEATTISS